MVVSVTGGGRNLEMVAGATRLHPALCANTSQGDYELSVVDQSQLYLENLRVSKNLVL